MFLLFNSKFIRPVKKHHHKMKILRVQFAEYRYYCHIFEKKIRIDDTTVYISQSVHHCHDCSANQNI